MEGSYSKAETTNPKDLFGAKKVSLTKLPAIGLLHGAHAMMDGARKYGPYNWRAKKVIASFYVDAAKRHLEAWFEGEELAEDSGVHHLGHALACCALLLDAQETGNLVDDRPQQGAETPLKSVYASVLKTLNARIARDADARAQDQSVETRTASKPEAPKGEYLSVHGLPEATEHDQIYSEPAPGRKACLDTLVRGQPPHYT